MRVSRRALGEGLLHGQDGASQSPSRSTGKNLTVSVSVAVAVGVLLSLACARGCVRWRSEPSIAAIGYPQHVHVPHSAAVRAGDHVYVSGQVSLAVGRGLEEQAREVLQKVGAALASKGLNKSHIVHTEGILADIADLTAFNVVYNHWLAGVEVVPACTVYQGARLDFRARVEVAVQASVLPHTGTNGSRGNVPQDDPSIPPGLLLPFTTVVRSGDLVYLSGLQATGNASAQIAGTLQNIDIALAAVGLDKSHLLKVDTILADVQDVLTFSAIYGRWLSGVNVVPAVMVHQPVNLCVNGKIEITVIASVAHPVGVNVSQGVPGVVPHPLPFTSLVQAGDLAYTSGVVSIATNATTEEQLADIFQSLSDVLSLGGLTLHDIVECRAVLKDIGDLPMFSWMYGRWLSGVEVLPAIMIHQTGEVSIKRDAKVEVAVVARRGTSGST